MPEKKNKEFKPPKTDFNDLTKKSVEKILEAVARGVTLQEAVKKTKISGQTFYNWMNSSKENRDLYYDALDNSSTMVESALFANATTGQNVAAQKYWLNNRSKGNWQEKIVTENTNTEKSEGVIDLSKLKPGELDQLRKLHAKAGN